MATIPNLVVDDLAMKITAHVYNKHKAVVSAHTRRHTRPVTVVLSAPLTPPHCACVVVRRPIGAQEVHQHPPGVVQ